MSGPTLLRTTPRKPASPGRRSRGALQLSCAMRATESLRGTRRDRERRAYAGAILFLLSFAIPAQAEEVAQVDSCDTSNDGAKACARLLKPAFVATSSTQPYMSLGLAFAAQGASAASAAGTLGQSQTQYLLTGSPQGGFRPFCLHSFPYLCLQIYGGFDGDLTAAVTPASLSQGATFAWDLVGGTVLQVHGDNWRLALN